MTSDTERDAERDPGTPRPPDTGPAWLLPLVSGVILAIVGAYTVTRSIVVTLVAAVPAVLLAGWIALLHGPGRG